MSYEIQLNGLEFHAYHGVFEHERAGGNTFVLDLKVSFPASRLPLNDRLEDAADYQQLYRIAQEEMKIPRKLLETLAGNMSIRLWASFPEALEILVSVRKKNPPIGTVCDSSAVVLRTTQPFLG